MNAIALDTITLPDGYNGHTVECDIYPVLDIDKTSVKLRVTGSDYLFRWCPIEDWIEAYNALGHEVRIVTCGERAAHLIICDVV